ncbi:MAG TPA: sensor histidine kinase [Gaiellaceae bacterium]|jgi:signal transduction histidine kinase|nr:sensor histidine kinase [Gaiellaceae bacterium]
MALVLGDEVADGRVEYREAVNRAVPLLKRYAFDAIIVLAAAGAVIEAVLRRNDEHAPDRLWLSILVQLALTLPLLARRLGFPLLAGILVFAAAISFAGGELVTFTFPVFIAILTVCFLLGMLDDRRQAVAGIAIAVGASFVVNANDADRASEDFVAVPILFVVVWIVGFALAHQLRQKRDAEARAHRAEREREERARSAVTEERQRIARELHDVVAHSISVMTVQAGGVRRLLHPDQTREREALETIEETGRQALAEMRRMLGILRQPTDEPTLAPQPSIATLEALVEQVREAGLPVEYRIEGEPLPLPPGVELSAYRIVQEALTNALRYAGPARAEVSVRYGRDAVELEITNDGRVDGDGEGAGHGLIGMRERVAVVGGTLEAGPREGADGFVVKARLPVKDAGA